MSRTDTPRRAGWRMRAAGLLVLGGCALAPGVRAEPPALPPGSPNVEQIVAGQQQRSYSPTAGILEPAALGAIGSSVIILQSGRDNHAVSHVAGSRGGVSATLQAGARNSAVAVIRDSPNSVIGQVQIGNDNTSVAAIVGGADNTLATVQVGSGLGAAVGLLDSHGTTLTYGQAGQNYNGGIVIKNAPPGTHVKVN